MSTKSTIGAATLLGVLFVALKLTGQIDWSWWLVTAPFWAGFALLLVVLAFMAGGWVVIAGLDAYSSWSRRRKSRKSSEAISATIGGN